MRNADLLNFKICNRLVPCHALTDAPCLSFSLSAALRLQLHRKTMRLQSCLAERKKYCAILCHLTRDMTLALRVIISVVVISMGIITRDGGIVQAADVPANSINYAYASWIGTGYYKIDDRNIFVLRSPFSYTLKEAGSENWGLEMLLPVTVGLNEFIHKYSDIALVSFVPGISLIYPVKENWRLKPFLQVGVGKDFSGGDASWIWGGGIKSLATFPYKKIEFDLGNSLMLADNSKSGQEVSDDGFSMWEIGLNVRWPVDFKVQNRNTHVNLFFVYTAFLNKLEFTQDIMDDTKVRRLFKFGIFLGAKDSFSIWGLGFRGMGIDYTHGDGFTGIGLTTGFPF